MRTKAKNGCLLFFCFTFFLPVSFRTVNFPSVFHVNSTPTTPPPQKNLKSFSRHSYGPLTDRADRQIGQTDRQGRQTDRADRQTGQTDGQARSLCKLLAGCSSAVPCKKTRIPPAQACQFSPGLLAMASDKIQI
jgi:hypothetical protein